MPAKVTCRKCGRSVAEATGATPGELVCECGNVILRTRGKGVSFKLDGVDILKRGRR